LPIGQPYVGQIEEFRLQDQSGNSHLINNPNGDPRDVLFNTKTGEHFTTFQIAKVPMAAIRKFRFPNPKSIRIDKHGKQIKEADLFTFDVKHSPTPCMYPHCVIRTARNGTDLGKKDPAEGVRTAIRIGFAELAESNRDEMLQYLNTGLPRRSLRIDPIVVIGAVLGSYFLYRILRFLVIGH
jgi:hypothetical protein